MREVRSADLGDEARIAADDELVTCPGQSDIQALAGPFEGALVVDDQQDGASLQSLETQDVPVEDLLGIPEAVPIVCHVLTVWWAPNPSAGPMRLVTARRYDRHNDFRWAGSTVPILERPEDRVRIGSLLVDIGRRARLTDEELTVFQQRDKTLPASAVGR